jgi:hypothetical protein
VGRKRLGSSALFGVFLLILFSLIMKLSEMINGLVAQLAERGDVDVVMTNPADDDDNTFYEVEVVTFVNRGTVVAPRYKVLIG